MKRYTWLLLLVVLVLVALVACSNAASPTHTVASVTTVPAPTAASTVGKAGVPTATLSADLAHAAEVSVTEVPTPMLTTTATLLAGSTDIAKASSSAEALAALEGTLENIYVQVNPSVVSIQVVEQVNSAAQPFGFSFPFGQPQQLPQGPQYAQAQGSGFVWDDQGHIVTNNHVIDGAGKIQVIFDDGTIVQGDVVGADPDSDLAVIKVDMPAGQLHAVHLADSAQVKVGQLAVAIGNPFGKQGTMTVGIVSAVGRYLPVNDGLGLGPNYTIPDIIQTDAPINPGNSGGVLVDDQGRVMGVTAAIESPVGANAGIGFAIPSAIVQKVVPALIDTGHYEHPRLGISGTTLTPDLAQAMDLQPDQRGALVVEVAPGGAADQAGLHGSDRQVQLYGQQVPVGGDVIVAIDGQPVKTFDDLVAYLTNETEVGQTVTLTVLRDGTQQDIPVTLEARPSSGAQGGDQIQGTQLGILGMTVTPDIARAMDLPASQPGIVIEQVQPGSPADEAGLRGSYKPITIGGQQLLIGGDIITAVDGQPVSQVEDLQTFLQQAQPGQEVTLTILRDGQKASVSVTLGEPSSMTP